MVRTSTLAALRERVQTLERGEGRRGAGILPFGLHDLDRRLPEGGLPLGALHDIAGETNDGACAAATLFLAGILARLPGPVLWCARRADVFAPGLALAGLDPNRVMFASDADHLAILRTMEEGLRSRSLTVVVGEVSRVTAIEARRLQLMAGHTGVTAFLLRRWQKADDATPFAVTRWRVTPLPSGGPASLGLDRARWRVELLRCRNGELQSWIVEASDASGRLAFPAGVADRPAAAAEWRAAG